MSLQKETISAISMDLSFDPWDLHDRGKEMTSLSCPLANCVSEGGIELMTLRVPLVIETFGAVLTIKAMFTEQGSVCL